MAQRRPQLRGNQIVIHMLSAALSCSQLLSAALSKEAIESSENCVFLANHCGAVVYWCTHSPFLASVVGVGG